MRSLLTQLSNSTADLVEILNESETTHIVGDNTFNLTVLVVDLGEGHTILLGRDVYEHYPQFAQAINRLKSVIEDSDRHILRHNDKHTTTHRSEAASAILVVIRPVNNSNEHEKSDTPPKHHTNSATDNNTDTEHMVATEQIKDLLSSIAASSFNDLTPDLQLTPSHM